MAKSVGVMVSLSEQSRLLARREKAANGDRAWKVQLGRLLVALKAYAA